MKLSAAFLTACAAATASASQHGAVYTFARSSSTQSSSTTPTLSPSNARLFVAQQLGLSEYHSLADVDEHTLQLLNQAQGSRAGLFEEQKQSGRRSLLIIDGAESDVLPGGKGSWGVVAELSQRPSTDSNTAFVDEMLSLDEERRGKTRACRLGKEEPKPSFYSGGSVGPDNYGKCSTGRMTSGSHAATDGFSFMRSALKASHQGSMHDGIVDVFYVVVPVNDNRKSALSSITDILGSTIDEQREGDKLTIVLLPEKMASRPSGDAWKGKTLDKRAKGEGLLASPAAKTSSSRKKPSPTSSKPVIGTSIVSATQPRCAASLEDCEARTNNCSGHGSCKAGNRHDKVACWSCSCSSTKDEWGTQYWGGPACQKRDVSVQFWLFAGFAVAGTSIIAWGIGMLYSMGEADLPSVLGAGVPPSSRK